MQHMAEVAQAASTHRQHQVVCRRGCRLSVMFTCHNVQTPGIEPVYRSNHGSIEGPGLATVCEGRAHTDSVQLEFSCARKSVVGPQVAQ